METSNVEDFYPLSPLQEGLLYHTLYAPDSGVYVVQLTCAIRGELNTDAFGQAWQRLIDRYAIFRTFFVWSGLDKAIQVLQGQVEIPIQHLDWSDLPSTERQEKFQEYLRDDRTQGFDLSRAPLMRLVLIRLDETDFQFIWSYHHLLLDGWCLSLILEEALAYYLAFSKDQDLSLEPPKPYRDYIVWLQQQDLSKAKEFWQRELSGFKSPTPLPVDRDVRGPLDEPGEYGECQVQVSTATTSKLQALARQHKLTLNTLIQGAWALLLNHYSGEKDIVYGTVVSGRPSMLQGAESMVGLFINTLPLRVQVEPNALLISWLKENQSRQVEARQYEYSPLVEVQGWSEVPRGTPLFESSVAFENYPTDSSLKKDDREFEIHSVKTYERPHYPLGLMVIPESEIILKFYYDSRRFELSTIIRLLTHLEVLLESFVAKSDQRVRDLSPSTELERQLIREWNQTAREYPRDSCIHELFEQQARSRPDKVAVVINGQHLTYQELNVRANQLARYLRHQGVGPEQIVGVCLKRSLEMIVALLGVLKAGGAYLPLDPAYPADRLGYYIEDSQAKIVVTEQEMRKMVEGRCAKVVIVDKESEEIRRMSEEDVRGEAVAENLAYVIYTSGSTGNPKGVMITHRGLCNFALAFSEGFDIDEQSCVLQFASLSFDASVAEIFTALVKGARLCLSRKDELMGPKELASLIADGEVTAMILPPSLLRMMKQEQIKGVKTLVVAGEASDRELAQRWAGGRKMINAYGPTEVTVCASLGEMRQQQEGEPNIGRAINNTRVYIMDEQQQEVPIGAKGEIVVSGEGVGRGYMRRAELTAEKYVPDPNSELGGARMYRTGDMGRWEEGGSIEFRGRKDGQVKVRGYRIELGEIERVVRGVEGVEDAVAMVREEEGGEKQIECYVVKGEGVEDERIREEMRRKLPEYMRVSRYKKVEEIPRRGSGKVDVERLKGMWKGEDEEGGIRRGEGARSEVEEKVMRIWEEVLKVEGVGVRENFFDLGGHSLMLMEVQGKLEEEFGREVSIADMFQYPTISSLAEYLTSDQHQQDYDNQIEDRAEKQREVINKQMEQFREVQGGND